MNLEPIRQVAGDGKREKIAAAALESYFQGWKLYGTPRFYFSDFHICLQWGNGRENYIGDLEVKWLKTDSSKPAIFPFNKLQQMMIAPPYTDNEHSYHRIVFRYSDGISVIPARLLAGTEPVFHTRWDTKERDLVVFYNAYDYPEYWHNLIINE